METEIPTHIEHEIAIGLPKEDFDAVLSQSFFQNLEVTKIKNFYFTDRRSKLIMDGVTIRVRNLEKKGCKAEIKIPRNGGMEETVSSMLFNFPDKEPVKFPTDIADKIKTLGYTESEIMYYGQCNVHRRSKKLDESDDFEFFFDVIHYQNHSTEYRIELEYPAGLKDEAENFLRQHVYSVIPEKNVRKKMFSKAREVFERKRKIHNIFFTGGPAGLKTEAIQEVIKYMQKEHKNSVAFVWIPEIATWLYDNHKEEHPSHNPEITNKEFQEKIANYYVDFVKNETRKFTTLCENKTLIVIHDRGHIDQKVYAGEDQYNELHEKLFFQIDFPENSLVLHCQSLAIDRKVSYEKYKASNPSRKEDVATAARIDSDLFNAWEKEPFFKVTKITNTGTKEDKLRNIISTILEHCDLV